MDKSLTIEEGNKLIAEFMGWKISKQWPNLPNQFWEKEGEEYWMKHDQFGYHSSWDWLMPVVEKIEGKEVDLNVSVVIKNDKCRIYRHKNSLYEMTVSDLHEGTTKIEATWKAIIDFIQWYNQNTKP